MEKSAISCNWHHFPLHDVSGVQLIAGSRKGRHSSESDAVRGCGEIRGKFDIDTAFLHGRGWNVNKYLLSGDSDFGSISFAEDIGRTVAFNWGNDSTMLQRYSVRSFCMVMLWENYHDVTTENCIFRSCIGGGCRLCNLSVPHAGKTGNTISFTQYLIFS